MIEEKNLPRCESERNPGVIGSLAGAAISVAVGVNLLDQLQESIKKKKKDKSPESYIPKWPKQ